MKNLSCKIIKSSVDSKELSDILAALKEISSELDNINENIDATIMECNASLINV